MVSTTLGKRTRNSKEAESELAQLAAVSESPAKRPRRLLRSASAAEKKLPSPTIDDVENEENQQPRRESPEADSTPKKAQVSRASTATVKPTPTIVPVTPSTPRHYDALATTSRGAATTPRHRVMSVGRISRRGTPQTPFTPNTLQTIYHQARQLFSRSADPGDLIGRDEERAQLKTFLARCSTDHPGGCLYVSGPPGTGKSAMVTKITDEVASESKSIRKAYINCMSIKSSKDLYITLLDQLAVEEALIEADLIAALQRLFIRKKPTTDVYLVVLDEIDHILTLDPESLYRVFEWSLQPTSRLTLVGIANALDLTDRFLPRLKSRNLKPELLPFLPYTAAQVKNIIITRLRSLVPKDSPNKDFTPFFHPAAIELCSRKVSSQTGDLRRAFEICRRAIDLVENETRMKYEAEAKEKLLQSTPSRKVALAENRNLATPVPSTPSSVASALTKSLASLTIETAPRVTIAHLNKVTAAAFSNGPAQRLKTLNLQQKAALCSLLAIEKRNRAALEKQQQTATPSRRGPTISAPTVKSLYEAYCHLCKRDSLLHPLSSSEFREVVGSLEALSLIAPMDGKNGSFTCSSAPQTPSRGGRKKKDVFYFGAGGCAGSGLALDEKRVASCVGEKEVEAAVEGLGEGILRGILSGEALDY